MNKQPTDDDDERYDDCQIEGPNGICGCNRLVNFDAFNRSRLHLSLIQLDSAVRTLPGSVKNDLIATVASGSGGDFGIEYVVVNHKLLLSDNSGAEAYTNSPLVLSRAIV